MMKLPSRIRFYRWFYILYTGRGRGVVIGTSELDGIHRVIRPLEKNEVPPPWTNSSRVIMKLKFIDLSFPSIWWFLPVLRQILTQRGNFLLYAFWISHLLSILYMQRKFIHKYNWTWEQSPSRRNRTHCPWLGEGIDYHEHISVIIHCREGGRLVYLYGGIEDPTRQNTALLRQLPIHHQKQCRALSGKTKTRYL